MKGFTLYASARRGALLLFAASAVFSTHAQPASDGGRVTVIGTAPHRETLTAAWSGVGVINGLDGNGAKPAWMDEIHYVKPVNDSVSYTGDCKSKRSNPITITTGNKSETDSDFSTPEEKGLFLTRAWNQGLNDRGIFGYNWISNFDKKLIFRWESGISCTPLPGAPCSGNTISRLVQVLAQRPDGRRIVVYQWQYGVTQPLYPISGSFAGGWTLKVDGESTETYSGGGLITSETNPNGIGWTYTYGGTNNALLQRVTHTNGRQVNFTYSGTQVSSVTDPAGSTYNYTNTSTEATVSYPGLPVTTLTYHFQTIAGMPSKALVGKSYNGVRYSTFGYDAGGRAISSEHAGGVEKSTYVYTLDSQGKISQVLETNPLGKTATYTVANGQIMNVTGNASANCPATARAYSYSSFGRNDVLVDNNGYMSDYDYSVNGQLTKLTEAVGTPAERVTLYTWDVIPKNRLLSETRPGRWSRTYTYTSSGRIATVTEKNLSSIGIPNQTHVVTYAYQSHANGMLSTMTISTPGRGTTTYSYTTMGELASVTDAMGYVTSYSLFNSMGLPGRSTGSNGDVTDFVYDARGRMVSRKEYPSGTAATTTFTYAGSGLLASVGYPDGTSLHYLRDNALRVMGEYLNRGSGTFDYKTFIRDNASNVTSEIIGRSTTAPVLGLATGATEKKFYDYDELSRVRAVRGNNGQSLLFTYDGNGNVKSAKDALNRTTSFDYDALNRLTTRTDALGGVQQLTYNSQDLVDKVIDPKGNATTYMYDGFGQLWAQSSPDTGVTTYTYGPEGLKTGLTRANGATTALSYDGAGRLTTVTSGANVQSFGYDWCANGKGRLCDTSSQGYTSQYAYTADGSVASKRDMMAFNAVSTDHWTYFYYDGIGRLNAITYPDGNAVGYGYAGGQLTTMTLNVAGVVTNLVSGATYRPFGSASSWAFGNGLARQLHFDQNYTGGDGRLTGVTTTDGSGWIQNLLLQYNSADEVLKINNSADPHITQTFGYDALGRLKTVVAPAGDETFYYDANGNKTRHVWTWDEGVTVAPNSNRVTAMTSHAYVNDVLGNRTSHAWGGSTATYGYDGFNRMTSLSRSSAISMAEPNHLVVNLPAGTNQYAYNIFNERIWKAAPSHGNYRYVYGPGSSLLAERNDSSGVWSDYLWFGGELVGVLRGATKYYVHNDQLGRPEIVTDSTKAVVWRARNYAFDRAVILDNMGGLNVGLPGQYYDKESNLWNNVNRYYDSRLGRYTQSDPVGLVGGLNTYAYAGSNPLSYIDPLGLQERPSDTDHLWRTADTNCSFTIDCKEALLGGGMVGSLTLGIVCARVTGIPVFSGILCNASVWMVCGSLSTKACQGQIIPIVRKEQLMPVEKMEICPDEMDEARPSLVPVGND